MVLMTVPQQEMGMEMEGVLGAEAITYVSFGVNGDCRTKNKKIWQNIFWFMN